MKQSLRIASVLLVALTLGGCGESITAPEYKVNLEMWGVFDDSDVYTRPFAEYHKANPRTGTIKYRKFNVDTYKAELLDSMASGTGPDVFMIRNTWLPDFKDKIVVAPPSVLSPKDVQDNLIDVVHADMYDAQASGYYGLPLSVDALALYYNRDILQSAGIATPPTTWEELISMLPKVTRVNEFGTIEVAGAAIGGGRNINRSIDILSLVLAQLGGGMNSNPDTWKRALEFYLSFSDINNTARYTWNAESHYSVDAFAEGRLAMMFGYSYHVNTLRAKHSKLNFAVAPMVQFQGSAPKNIANYWVLVVAKNKKADMVPLSKTEVWTAEQENNIRTIESWQLITALALPHAGGAMVLQHATVPEVTNPVTLAADPGVLYLEASGKPAARRDLIAQQQTNVWMDPFVRGNLIATSTMGKRDMDSIEGAITDTIDNVLAGRVSLSQALSTIAATLR